MTQLGDGAVRVAVSEGKIAGIRFTDAMVFELDGLLAIIVFGAVPGPKSTPHLGVVRRAISPIGRSAGAFAPAFRIDRETFAAGVRPNQIWRVTRERQNRLLNNSFQESTFRVQSRRIWRHSQ
ncbi:hypothetical protein [[Mycobacterium] wendilense]|uniref:Uncharacterized protein n=1 Tax=[Mycobacterium] wendilense TaxID=3064284 RepID=A0ABM9MDX4_9MYCO|nr:hypothetical protein [Mycolicibacterium sp. MU0050]CAJ1582887.1 hypothetical protein MU0050_002329 [Mycolicibacterium sp. MU0050]